LVSEAKGSELPRRRGEFALADRQFARTVLIGLAVLGAVSTGSVFLSYRRDVAESQTRFRTQIAGEALVYAESLSLHFRLLQAELERLALRPEVNLEDNTIAPEQLILDFTHRQSTLFSGVALLDVHGNLVWSEPKDILKNHEELSSRLWFQKVLALGVPVVEALGPEGPSIAVAVPILRSGRPTGVVLGVVNPSTRPIPGGTPIGEHLTLVLLDRAGTVFLPPNPPTWALRGDFHLLVDGLLEQGRAGWAILLDNHDYFAAATLVGNTGLRLVLISDEHAVIGPTRLLFLWQLLLIVALQFLTILLFWVLVRRTHRAFVKIETRVAEQEKMVALGSAASLIAHEVKNSLNGLKSAASLLTAGSDPQMPARAILGQIDRLGHLASSLLYFGKPNAPQLVSTQLDRIVKETVEGLRVLPEAEEVRIETELESPLTVRCDPLLLGTALDNIVRNAMEAAVQAKDLGKVQNPEVHIRAGRRDGEAFVTVEDNAGGVPEHIVQSLFEPFVTSKPKGIGLGLSMARRALEQQGGSLAFERTALGSRFTVRLAFRADAS